MSWRLPLLLAALLTLLNAAKPAVVDDTAYLLFARHLASAPADPYGFTLFWYTEPQPAMQILLPPVLPYWLAAGMTLVGEHLFLLKLWLFPFALLLTLSVSALLKRFATGCERAGLVAFTLSPAVLPLFNFMLDVPALALGAAAVAAFVRGVDGRRVGWVLAGGVLAGLAMQTKYTMLAVPAVVSLYAVSRWNTRRTAIVDAAVAVGMAAAVFVGWELYVTRTNGESHFLHHVRNQSGGGGLWATVAERTPFVKPLLALFGGLLGGVSLVASRGAGWPGWVRVTAAVSVAGGLAAVCLLPFAKLTLAGGNGSGTLNASLVLFLVVGGSVVVTVAMAVGRSVWRGGWSADTLFLLGWVAVEVVGMIGMTPFPAARRVVGVSLATAVLAMHAVSRLRPWAGDPPRWTMAFAASLGLLVWAVDVWDARVEQWAAERAAEVVTPQPGEAVWYTGHWGFQWYAERAGMRPFLPDRTALRQGDWLVLPIMPDLENFYRPWPPDRELPRPTMSLEVVAEIVWDDRLSAQTVPHLYTGGSMVQGRDHPRLRVVVYRATADWPPEGPHRR